MNIYSRDEVEYIHQLIHVRKSHYLQMDTYTINQKGMFAYMSKAD